MLSAGFSLVRSAWSRQKICLLALLSLHRKVVADAGKSDQGAVVMAVGMLGRKIGMTQVYDANGTLVPVTVVEAGPCTVLQVKTLERDG